MNSQLRWASFSDGQSIRFLLKLIAHRRKELADVEEIFSICKDIELSYLREWADKLKLTERLVPYLPNR